MASLADRMCNARGGCEQMAGRAKWKKKRQRRLKRKRRKMRMRAK